MAAIRAVVVKYTCQNRLFGSFVLLYKKMEQNEIILVRVKYLNEFKFVTLPVCDLKPIVFCQRGELKINKKNVEVFIKFINSKTYLQLLVPLNSF